MEFSTDLKSEKLLAWNTKYRSHYISLWFSQHMVCYINTNRKVTEHKCIIWVDMLVDIQVNIKYIISRCNGQLHTDLFNSRKQPAAWQGSPPKWTFLGSVLSSDTCYHDGTLSWLHLNYICLIMTVQCCTMQFIIVIQWITMQQNFIKLKLF